MRNRSDIVPRRFLDEIIEAFRRSGEDLQNIGRNNNFDPNDPRLLNAMLLYLSIMVGGSVLALALTIWLR